MRSIFFLLSLATVITANAEIYKCVSNGKTTYSENRCDDTGNMISKNSNAGLTEGLAAFENGNFATAYSRLQPLAESGIAMAQNTLGRMYLLGQGVPKNPDLALILFRRAAEKGLPNAQNNLGVLYSAGSVVPQDYRQAIVWFKKGADQGFALAMENLADMYENGLGVKPNQMEADRWRNKSQKTGGITNSTPVAIETVGKTEYEKGLEFYFQWDFFGAAQWFEKAATKGHPEAQLRLATMYQTGQGVTRSEERALHWSRRAKSGGHSMDDTRDRVILIDSSPREQEYPRLTPITPVARP